VGITDFFIGGCIGPNTQGLEISKKKGRDCPLVTVSIRRNKYRKYHGSAKRVTLKGGRQGLEPVISGSTGETRGCWCQKIKTRDLPDQSIRQKLPGGREDQREFAIESGARGKDLDMEGT